MGKSHDDPELSGMNHRESAIHINTLRSSCKHTLDVPLIVTSPAPQKEGPLV